MSYSIKRGRSPSPSGSRSERMSRWGGSREDNAIKDAVNLPTIIDGILTPEQLDAYQIVYRIDEITQKISTNDLIPPMKLSRSPSPPPQYDASGKRTNTRDARYKKSLEDERHHLIEIAARLVPHYVAPTDYRRPKALVQKYYIPVKEHPELNFIGLLLGPRGNTLRKLQETSGAKIAIRGKGSVKEGKNRAVSTQQNNLEDPLHCLITADTEEKVLAGIEACKDVVNRAISTPEGQNDLKRGQLRELAALNGTLREDEDRPCQVCGLRGHKRWECPNRSNYTSQVVCRICGNTGHFARDCKQRNGGGPNNNNGGRFNVDQEFDNMLKDINVNNYTNNNGEQQEEQPWKKRNTGTQSPLPPSQPSSISSSSAPSQTHMASAPLGAPGAPGLSQPPGFTAPPAGLSMPPGLGAPPGLSAPPGIPQAGIPGVPPSLSAPPGIGAPPGISAPPGLPDLLAGSVPPPGAGPPGLSQGAQQQQQNQNTSPPSDRPQN